MPPPAPARSRPWRLATGEGARGSTPGDLRERWRAKAKEIGLDREAIARDLGPRARLSVAAEARTASTARSTVR